MVQLNYDDTGKQEHTFHRAQLEIFYFWNRYCLLLKDYMVNCMFAYSFITYIILSTLLAISKHNEWKLLLKNTSVDIGRTVADRVNKFN